MMAGASPIDVDNIVEVYNKSGDETDTAEDRPIMLLLKSLIRNKQNTVMTNAQIIDILQKEYAIDIEKQHELDVDIFIKIIKKYLKDWPQWEELERVSSKLKNLNDLEAVKQVLNHKYKNLKEYLGAMLDIAKEAVLSVDDINKQKQITSQPNPGEQNVLMEILCTRDQLNHLINRYPEVNNKCLPKPTIFNFHVDEPKCIQYSNLSLESVLKLWPFKVTICLPWFIFYRELIINYEHVLVNKARKRTQEKSTTLLTEWQMKCNQNMQGKRGKISRQDFIAQINRLYKVAWAQTRAPEVLKTICDVIKNDLSYSPEEFCQPSMYRRYCNANKYVRYLFRDNTQTQGSNKVDLQLEEYVSPQLFHYFSKVKNVIESLPSTEEWLKVECCVCNTKFFGTTDIKNSVVLHYEEYHMDNKPDFQCTNCKNVFSVEYLAENKWKHNC